MGKKTAVGGAAASILALAALVAYSNLVGFEKKTLASKLPEDTLAYASIRHLRKTGFAFATDETLQAYAAVFQAIAKAISDAAVEPADETESIDIDPQLLRDLGSHFKTQLAIAALPPSTGSNDSDIPHFALLSNFYGSEDRFLKTLSNIARQASTDEESYQLTRKKHEVLEFYEVQISFEGAEVALPNFQPHFAIHEGIFYLSSDQATLLSLLERNQPNAASQSFAETLLEHKANQFVSGIDFELILNGPPSIRYLSDLLQRRLDAKGGLYPTVTVKTFFEKSGIGEIESLYYGLDFNDQRSSYSSLRYKSKSGLLDCFEATSLAYNQYPETLPSFAASTTSLNSGKALLVLKNAALRAAPLANIPYIAYRTKLLRETGIDLEGLIESSFQPSVSTLYTLDTGTSRDANGRIEESIAFDFAAKFKLSPNHELNRFFQERVEPQIRQAAGNLAFREGDVLYVDSDPDASVSANRIATSIESEYLTIGYGTLRSFEILRTRKEVFTEIEHSLDSSLQIGSGVLSLQALPTTLYRLATVFYLQLNPGKGVPSEFHDFDWSFLRILEQDRESTLYDDGKGHIYRLSQHN